MFMHAFVMPARQTVCGLPHRISVAIRNTLENRNETDQNACIERFNRTHREEVLSAHHPTAARPSQPGDNVTHPAGRDHHRVCHGQPLRPSPTWLLHGQSVNPEPQILMMER